MLVRTLLPHFPALLFCSLLLSVLCRCNQRSPAPAAAPPELTADTLYDAHPDELEYEELDDYTGAYFTSEFVTDSAYFAAAPVGIRVTNRAELLNALRSDTTIVLVEGSMIVLEGTEEAHPYFDGEYLHDLRNLRIVGEGRRSPLLVQTDGYEHVLKFRDCRNVELENIRFGHYAEPGWCEGGVLLFHNCEDVYVGSCELFGSGTEGFTLIDTDTFYAEGCLIHKCTQHLSTFSHSHSVVFDRCTFTRNETDLLRGFAFFASDVKFRETTIEQPDFDLRLDYGYYHDADTYGKLFTFDRYDFAGWYLERAQDLRGERSGVVFEGAVVNGGVVFGVVGGT